VVYSAVPIEFLFANLPALTQPNFPLEGYSALQDAVLLTAFRGDVAHLPVYVVYRPVTKQLVIAISGTSSLHLAMHDLRALMHRHYSGRGSVHSGFWGLYKGIRIKVMDAIRNGLRKHKVAELVITGHSMGGSVSYLLCMDMLAGFDPDLLPSGMKLKLAVFGSPRTGNERLVQYWEELSEAYRARYGKDAFVEYSVKAHNDGVPALPLYISGYRHFTKEPLYLAEDRLYRVPMIESEHTLFHASRDEKEIEAPNFPLGGHNYYNGRDLERFTRRTTWLDKAIPGTDGWQERYTAYAMHHE